MIFITGNFKQNLGSKHRNNAMNSTSLHNLREPSCPLGNGFGRGPVFLSVGPSFSPPSSHLKRCRCTQHPWNHPLPFYHTSELSASHWNTETLEQFTGICSNSLFKFSLKWYHARSIYICKAFMQYPFDPISNPC